VYFKDEVSAGSRRRFRFAHRDGAATRSRAAALNASDGPAHSWLANWPPTSQIALRKVNGAAHTRKMKSCDYVNRLMAIRSANKSSAVLDSRTEVASKI